MMKFLKFPSKEIFDEKCEEAGLMIEGTAIEGKEGQKFLKGSPEYSIDVVGTIYTPGQYEIGDDRQIVEVSAPVAHEGFHVNMLGIVPSEFVEYLIDTPATPHRVFFGY